MSDEKICRKAAKAKRRTHGDDPLDRAMIDGVRSVHLGLPRWGR